MQQPYLFVLYSQMFSNREDTSKKTDSHTKSDTYRQQELEYCPHIQELKEVPKNTKF